MILKLVNWFEMLIVTWNIVNIWKSIIHFVIRLPTVMLMLFVSVVLSQGCCNTNTHGTKLGLMCSDPKGDLVSSKKY